MVDGDLPVRRGDEVHEQLRQFLIVDRVVDGERADAGRVVRRVVAAAGEDGVDGVRTGVHRGSGGRAASEMAR